MLILEPCGGGPIRSGYYDLGGRSETLGAPGESTVIEGVEGLAVATAREVQGVGEIHAPAEKVQRGDDPAGFLQVYVCKPQQMLDDLDHPRRLKPIEGPEHPFQFQDYGERNEQAGALGDDLVGDRALLGCSPGSST